VDDPRVLHTTSFGRGVGEAQEGVQDVVEAMRRVFAPRQAIFEDVVAGELRDRNTMGEVNKVLEDNGETVDLMEGRDLEKVVREGNFGAAFVVARRLDECCVDMAIISSLHSF
jgi:hypothetical protein